MDSLPTNVKHISSDILLYSNKKLGSGAFGVIFEGLIKSQNRRVAIKIGNSKDSNIQLEHEARIYSKLKRCVGIPYVHSFIKKDNYNILIMELLGKSIEDLFIQYQRKFSLDFIVQLSNEVIDKIKVIHSKGFIHRDLKPDNILVGEKESKIYIIDFGLAKRYTDPKTDKHIPMKEGKSLTGTSRYASVNTHLGKEQSRRDDIEAFAYMIIYLCKGSLPWQGVKAKSLKEKYEKIKDIKLKMKTTELCKDLPKQIQDILIYARCINFQDEPDYAYIKELLKEISISRSEEIEKQNLDFFKVTIKEEVPVEV